MRASGFSTGPVHSRGPSNRITGRCREVPRGADRFRCSYSELVAMSKQADTLDAGDWSGTETLTMEAKRENYPQADTVLRYLNDLDVEATCDLYVTHGSDTGNSHGTNTDTKIVSAGAVDGALVTEPWERFFVDVTPTTSPSTGTITLQQVGGQ